MPRPGAFGSYREDPPAIIAPARDLFSWAREQAAAIAETRDLLAKKRAALVTIEAVVEESGEFGDVEEAMESLKKAKDAALDCDAVLSAKKKLKAARKSLKKVAAVSKMKAIQADVKALRGVVEESKDRLATGLASGKVPNAIDDAVGEAIDGMARAAGEGGCVTFTGGGQSVTIKGKGKRGAAGS